MKRILLTVGLTSLLTMNGCLVAEDGHHHHGHSEVYVQPAVVVVHPAPVVVVRPAPVVVVPVRIHVD